MNYHELQEAKATFDLTNAEKLEKRNDILRRDFVKYYTIKRIAAMTIDDYVVGKQSKSSFCYRIEHDLDALGRITGQPSTKFGIWYSPDEGTYKYDPVFGDTYQEAFANVKKAIIEIIECGKTYNYDVIISNRFNSLIKGKILSTYYPEKYLNIFSVSHIDYYLTKLNIDNKELKKRDVLYKRDALLEFKSHDKDMRKWSVAIFAMFLYSHYPKAPIKDKDRGSKPIESDFEFPIVNSVEFVSLSLADAPKETPKNKNAKVNVSHDYEKEARRNKKFGDRGEKIVYDAEIERIRSDFDLTEAKAKKKVKWISRDSDAYGYDILSVNKNGTPRYIEVKATQSNVGDMDFYYTQNELDTAMKYGKNYYIYIVYCILSSEPKIWVLQNPFIKKDKLELLPIKYKVKVRTKLDPQ